MWVVPTFWWHPFLAHHLMTLWRGGAFWLDHSLCVYFPRYCAVWEFHRVLPISVDFFSALLLVTCRRVLFTPSLNIVLFSLSSRKRLDVLSHLFFFAGKIKAVFPCMTLRSWIYLNDVLVWVWLELSCFSVEQLIFGTFHACKDKIFHHSHPCRDCVS